MVQGFGEKKNTEFLIRNEKKDLKLQGLSDRVRQTLKPRPTAKARSRGAPGGDGGPQGGRGPCGTRPCWPSSTPSSSSRSTSPAALSKSGVWPLIMAGVLVGATLLVQALIVALGGDEPASAMVMLIVTALVVTVGACWLLKAALRPGGHRGPYCTTWSSPWACSACWTRNSPWPPWPRC